MLVELKMPEDKIYVKSQVDGKLIKITAIGTSAREVNYYLTKHPDEGVIYQVVNNNQIDEMIFVADKNDLGV